MSPAKPGTGIRTRLLLQISVACIIAATMALSGLMVRSRLRQHVQDLLQMDLRHSLMTFQDLQANNRTALERENSLLATLPTLRAVMKTRDARTIRASEKDFWMLSGNELFALASADGTVLDAYANGVKDNDELREKLQAIIGNPAKHYMFACGHLYEYTITPIYLNTIAKGMPPSVQPQTQRETTQRGEALGYVIGGYAVDNDLLRQVGRGAGAEAIFLNGMTPAVSTLPPDQLKAFDIRSAQPTGQRSMLVRLNNQRYLAISRNLSSEANVTLRLVLLKSFDSADRTEMEIRRIVLVSSLLSIGAGCLLMLLLARNVTAPLERLADGVKAFAGGDQEYRLPVDGPREVRYLSSVMGDMRDEIQKKNRALLESERLATIGRMASSVSHDLRHYLAAVYANAEFLASPTLPATERAELFEEIRMAVNGTTDMLDALLLFGSTGSELRRVPTPMSAVVERAVALVRNHPDAAGVTVKMTLPAGDTTVNIDTRQMERAIYNLLLNACQSADESCETHEVEAAVQVDGDTVSVTVRDTGAGVPDGIRHSLFDPFVSKGKQKGTGLGLTLAHSVAHEHNGDVELLSSRPGETIFRLTVTRSSIPQQATPVVEPVGT